MKLPPLLGSFRGWWFIVALVVGPAVALAALGLRALRLERVGREQELWREQSRLVLLVDGAISNVLAALEADLRRGELGPPVNSPAREAGRFAPFTRFVFDRRQLLIFPDDRVFFGEIGLRPTQAPSFSLSGDIVRNIEEAQAAEARNENPAALNAYRRIDTSEPRLHHWMELNIARIEYRQRDAEMVSALQKIDLGQEDAISPSGVPVAMLACSYAAQLPGERRTAFQGLFRQTLTNIRGGRWWLAYQQRTLYDEELVGLLSALSGGKSTGPNTDERMHDLALIEEVARRSSPRQNDVPAKTYDYTEDGGLLLLWAPADNEAELWHGAALFSGRIHEWLQPLLNPLFEGLQFGATLRDSRQQLLWANTASSAPPGRRERLRSVPEWELGFIAAPDSVGIDPKRILWYGFIFLPVVMLIVGMAAAARVFRKEHELARMQSDFIAAVSHEFKSPLTGIRLLLERIAGRRHSSPESIAEYCRAMEKETSRLERLVNRLLEWQQIEAGQKHYRFKPGSLAEVARSTVELLRPQAEAKGVSIDLKVEGEMPDLFFDRAAITDTLENLVDNAIKYSPGGGRVSVDLCAGNTQVTVEVSDEGIGIDPEDLPRIFEKFYRGRRGNQEDVRGTGLGLTLVKAALDAHGGKVEVRSTPGKGSRFTITLPIHREEDKHGPGSDRG